MTALSSSTVLLRGGLDLVGPPVSIQEGYCIAGYNYEADVKGYTRFAGYERFDGQPKPSAADNDADRDARRSAINAVPGSGPVRGVFRFKGAVYAIRDNGLGTAGVMHVATNAGWVPVDLGGYLLMDGLTAEFFEGDTITGAVSGATGEVQRAALQTGAWTAGTGFLTLTNVVGDFQAGEGISGALGGTGNAVGPLTDNTLPAGGNYEFEIFNFYGSRNRKAVYGVNGAGPAFEFDGTVFSQIFTGLDATLNKPTHVGILKNHLFLGFVGGSLQFSEIGSPLQWQAIGGAGEIGFGDDFTDIKDAFLTTLIVIGRNKIGFVAGASAADFSLEILIDEAGGVRGTAQSVGNVLYVDQLGLRDISSTQSFGNFKRGTLSTAVEPIFSGSASAVGSMRVRKKGTYRLFFDNGTVLSTYLGRERPEHMLLNLPIQFSCGYSDSEDELREASFVGATDGFVYELDIGTSFDGAIIDAFVRFPYLHFGSPTQNKCFFQALLQVTGPPQANISLAAEYDYGSPEEPSAVDDDFSVFAGGGFWDEANWDEFYWSSQVVGQAKADLDGFGPNISTVIASNQTGEEPHTLSDITYFYSSRGLAR